MPSAIIQAVKPAISPGLEMRPMREGDVAQVLTIYQAGLDTGQASPQWLTSRLPASEPPERPRRRRRKDKGHRLARTLSLWPDRD